MSKMFRLKAYLRVALLLFVSVFMIVRASGQLKVNPNHSIGTLSGKYHFSYEQTPEQLVEVSAPGFPNTGFTYQWQSSLTPVGVFTPIPGATQSSYSPPQLEQTTYFQRVSTNESAGVTVISNVVKISVVSVNWEDKNYIREHDVTVSGITTWKQVDKLPIGQKFQTTSYLDGSGRSIQKVSRETATPAAGSSVWGDMVQFSEYDVYGREVKKRLPYTTTTQSGKFKSSPGSEQEQYYLTNYNETNPFHSISFDKSPLNRQVNIKQPGSIWSAAAGTTASYEVNSAADNVQLFSVDYIQGNPPVNNGSYAGNTLFKLVLKDEHGKEVIEYRNKAEQLILRKVQIDDVTTTGDAGWICTYNVYDDLGLLRYEIQPEAVKYLQANNWSFAGSNGQQVLNELCFQYNYDDKGRVIWKKAPGAAPLNMIYDSRDRLVFMQDGNQAIKPVPEWTANLYDELDRPVLTCLYSTTNSITQLQSSINNAAVASTVTINNPDQPVEHLMVDTRVAGVSRYAAKQTILIVSDGEVSFQSSTNDSFVAEIDQTAVQPAVVTTTILGNPITGTELNNSSITTIVKYHFYDDYSFNGAQPFDNHFTNLTAYSNSDPNVLPIVPSKRTTNFLTGTLIRVLGTNTFLSSTQYFDDKGNCIQSLADNIKSGKDVTTLQYHFDGRVLSTDKKHSAANSGYASFHMLSKNFFDKIGRITSKSRKYGTNGFKVLASFEYDDAGRLKNKKLAPGYTGSGKSELESLAYSYNIHNNLTGINKDYALKTPGKYNKWDNFFGMYLGFDNREGLFSKADLTGQITGLIWNTQGDDAQRKYDYTYDHAGRLSTAVFKERQTTSAAWSNTKMDFSVSGRNGKIEYDHNGNILFMLQKGVLPGSTSPVTIDNLEYTYALYSNQLRKVTDIAGIASNAKSGDFKDGTNSTDDYVYDENGNLVIDLNKNLKDLPGLSANKGIRYNFLDKPEEIYITGKGTVKIVYDADGNKLQRSFTPEGSSTTTTTSYVNEFLYKGDELEYISFEEGRIRVIQPVSESNGYDAVTVDGSVVLPNGKKGVYDYYVTDYQSNVRMILTEGVHVGSNQCTMETARAANEEPLFGQTGSGNEVVQTRFAVASIPGQSSGGGWQNTSIGSHVSRLGNLVGKKTGPNALLKVMAGDQVSAHTLYYYKDPVVNTSGNNLLTDVLGSLIQGIAGSNVTSSVTKGATAEIYNQLNSSIPFSSAVAPDAPNTAGDNPKAYLTVLFFNERFEFVSEGSTSLRVQGAGSSTASLTLANNKAPKNGYAFVYVSNESDETVYFDNLQVAHERGRLIEENHYYAYGLKIAAISSRKLGDAAHEGHLENKFLYQGEFSELDEDLGWNDFALRNYDPQIGRWIQQDPFQQYSSPYVGMGDNPVNIIDPSGGIGIPCPGTSGLAIFLSNVGNTALQALSTISTIVSVTNLAATTGTTFINVSQSVSASNAINNTMVTNAVGIAANAASSIYKQSLIPKIVLGSGGIKGIELDATFNVTDLEADGLQIIQTFQGTRRDDGVQVGRMTIKEGNVTYDAFVDGGKNSPYVTIGGNPPAHRNKPYYLTSTEVSVQVRFNRSKKVGSIRVYDRPGAVAVHKIAKFETIIIAINYKGSGKDKVLGSFSWGWRSNGRIRLHTGNGVQLNKTITPTSRRIIKYDYPSYQLP